MEDEILSARIANEIAKVRGRERARSDRRALARDCARAAARALRSRYGAHLTVFVFGSVLQDSRFRLRSDIDLAVSGIPEGRYYEAWGVAEDGARKAGWNSRVDFVMLERAPEWLAVEIREQGERI